MTRFFILKQTDTSNLEQFWNITPFSMYKQKYDFDKFSAHYIKCKAAHGPGNI